MKNDVEELKNGKKLSEESLEQVGGGKAAPSWPVTTMDCDDCGYVIVWDGDYYSGKKRYEMYVCPRCGHKALHGTYLSDDLS